MSHRVGFPVKFVSGTGSTFSRDTTRQQNKIEEEVKKAKENNEKIVIVGDFNCKVGSIIPNNKEEVTMGGRMLRKVIKRNRLEILNGNKKGNGQWTRQENGKNSLIVYVVTSKYEAENNFVNMIIDEEKKVGMYRLIKEGGTIKTKYSDHNTIMCSFNWYKEISQNDECTKEEVKLKMNKNDYDRYTQEIQDIKISEMWNEEGDIDIIYDKRNEKIKQIIAKNSRKIKKRKR